MSVRSVAVVVSGMDEEYPYQIIQGINKFAKENNVNISYFAAFAGIIDSRDFDLGEFSVYNLPDFSKFDGVILLSNTFSNPDIRNSIAEKVKAAKTPAVILECRDHPEFHDISIDNYTVMKKLVEHLIEVHEAKVFNFIAGPESNPEASDRYRAFRDALAEHDIEFDEENRLFKGLFRSFDGIKAIESFESSGMSMPDAFVCANDSMALTAMSSLQRMGYKVPEDVIITGFDNIQNARNACPELTTISRPLFDSGSKACSVLLDIMDGKDVPRSTILEAEPVYSESCGCCNEDMASMKEFKKIIYSKIEHTNISVHMLNRLIADLAEAQNIEDCIKSIEKVLIMIDCKKFSLCLVEDWEDAFKITSLEEDTGSYPPVLTAPLVWHNDERRSVKKFPSSQLYPEPLKTGGNISYFLPLHFSERCLGYYIMTNNDFPINSVLCHTMTMCIGNAIDKISKLNVLDPLCKIYNRNGFNINADFLFKKCISEESPFTMFFIDLDGLKQINDTYGHKEGDYAISSVAAALKASCGSSDICGRFGGDEFVAAGRGTKFAEAFEKKVMKKLEKLNNGADKPYSIAASIGHITVVPSKEDTLLDLIERADEEMYKIKNKR